MKMMFPIVASKADRMIEFLSSQIKSENLIEMKEIFSSYTTESIASVAFGIETEVYENDINEFRKHGKSVFEPTYWEKIKSLIVSSFGEFSKLTNLRVTSQETIDFFQGTVRETLDYRQKNNVKRNDFFQLAMEIMKNDESFTFEELAANCFLFFLAG
jgi:cytochrome P450 family 6